MSFEDSVKNRYTTKQYDPAKRLTAEQRDALKRIVHLSPSSINSQPWHFTFVEDQAMKEKLSGVSWHNTQKVLDADTVVVFSRIDNIALFEQQIIEELPEGAVNYFQQFVKPLPEAEIKSWFDRQVYLALGLFLSACAEMGIDSTPMEGIETDQYYEVLGLNDYHAIVAVAIGHRSADDFNQPHKKPKSRRKIEKVIQTI